MRLFLSILFTAIFFIAPNKSNAAEKHIHSITSSGKAGSKTSFIAHLTDLDLTAFPGKSAQNSGNGIRLKLFSLNNFISPDGFSSRTGNVTNNNYFVAVHPLHIPIALKLLFPKHYFW